MEAGLTLSQLTRFIHLLSDLIFTCTLLYCSGWAPDYGLKDPAGAGAVDEGDTSCPPAHQCRTPTQTAWSAVAQFSVPSHSTQGRLTDSEAFCLL